MPDEPMLRDLLGAVPVPMLLISPDARVRLANAPARSILGPCEDRHFLTVIRQPEPVEVIERVLAGGQAEQVRWRISGPGRDRHYRGQVSPVWGAGVSFAFEDLSDVEHAADMRRDFVANVSHELRTPLTALMGFVETLRGAAKDDPNARDRFLGIMEREALRMNRLVGELLSLSRVEAEERVLPTARIDLRALAGSVVNTLTPLAQSAGVELIVEAPDAVPEITGDLDQLTQVLQNLIENAIKYGGSGGQVRVALSRLAHDAQLRGPAASLSVTDYGEGIAALHLPRLTERFYRVDSHRSREKGGTGLGLAICKHILNRHRGRLRIESEPGKGSRFEVILPITASDAASSET